MKTKKKDIDSRQKSDQKTRAVSTWVTRKSEKVRVSHHHESTPSNPPTGCLGTVPALPTCTTAGEFLRHVMLQGDPREPMTLKDSMKLPKVSVHPSGAQIEPQNYSFFFFFTYKSMARWIKQVDRVFLLIKYIYSYITCKQFKNYLNCYTFSCL